MDPTNPNGDADRPNPTSRAKMGPSDIMALALDPNSLDPHPLLPRNVVLRSAQPLSARQAFFNKETPRRFLISQDGGLDAVLPQGQDGVFLFHPDIDGVEGPVFDELFSYVAFTVQSLHEAELLAERVAQFAGKDDKKSLFRDYYIQGYFGSPSGPPALSERDIGRQNYLLPARYGGIDAVHAWVRDARGQDEIVYVLESGCWTEHDDFLVTTTSSATLRSVSNPFPGPPPTPDLMHSRQHGTATLGIMVATQDTLSVRRGIAGIAHAATAEVALMAPGLLRDTKQFSAMVAKVHTVAAGNPAKGEGAIILLELCHMPVGTNLWLPLETDPFFRDAIDLLMAPPGSLGCGAVVIEPAGNSDENIDSHLPNPSGAIIVGASRHRAPFAKTLLSNFSKKGRVPLFSWGEEVYTTSVTLQPWSSDPPQPWDFAGDYTHMSETSAAAAIIAGAAAVVQARHRATSSGGAYSLNCQEMRDALLKDATPCQLGAGIGHQPNLKAIMP